MRHNFVPAKAASLPLASPRNETKDLPLQVACNIRTLIDTDRHRLQCRTLSDSDASRINTEPRKACSICSHPFFIVPGTATNLEADELPTTRHWPSLNQRAANEVADQTPGNWTSGKEMGPSTGGPFVFRPDDFN